MNLKTGKLRPLVFPLLILLFFVLRLIFIFRFPLLEAESSNIRYGQAMVTYPDLRFASLVFANKQPLAYWLFGFGSAATGDIVFGSRLVSVLFGFASLLLLYIWVRDLWNQETATYAAFFMTISPLFVLLQSVALMESILFFFTLVCLWSITRFMISQKLFLSVILGVCIALGLWTKTNFVIIGVVSLLTIGYISFTKRPFRLMSLVFLVFPLCISGILLVPLLVQPEFSKVLGDVSVFTFSFSELIAFPISVWTGNIYHVFYSFLLYGGPGFLLSLLFGLRLRVNRRVLFVILTALVLLLAPVVVNKAITTRYYFPAFVPLLAICGFGCAHIYTSRKFVLKVFSFVCLLATILLSFILVYDARIYFRLFPDIFPLRAERGYALGWSGGYATREALSVLNNQRFISGKAVIAVQDFPGNPTDWIVAEYYFDENRPIVFLNQASELNRLKPFGNKIPAYFITRSNLYYEDLKPYMTLIHSFRSPDSDDYVEIYRINTYDGEL